MQFYNTTISVNVNNICSVTNFHLLIISDTNLEGITRKSDKSSWNGETIRSCSWRQHTWIFWKIASWFYYEYLTNGCQMAWQYWRNFIACRGFLFWLDAAALLNYQKWKSGDKVTLNDDISFNETPTQVNRMFHVSLPSDIAHLI